MWRICEEWAFGRYYFLGGFDVSSGVSFLSGSVVSFFFRERIFLLFNFSNMGGRLSTPFFSGGSIFCGGRRGRVLTDFHRKMFVFLWTSMLDSFMYFLATTLSFILLSLFFLGGSFSFKKTE